MQRQATSNSSESEAVTLRVLTDLREVEAIASEWEEVLQRSPCNRAFSSACWYLAACRHDPAISPYVIVARRGANLAGILPLALTDNGDTAAFATDLSDYNDIIAARDDAQTQFLLLQRAFSATGGYRTLKLYDVRQDSNCFRALQRLRQIHDVHQSSLVKVCCPYIHLQTSHEEYLATKKSSFFKSLRYAQRNAARNELVIKELQPQFFPSTQLPEIFLSLHRDRYRELSVFAPEAAQSFVREIFPALFTARRLRALALIKQDRIPGLNICLPGENSLCYWNGGFLTDARRWSPGKLLIDAGIKLARALKLDEYDFLRGSESYKSDWADSARDISRMEFTISVH